MKWFNKKPKTHFLEGYIQGPLSHHKASTSTQRESEYFMQWVHPLKLHRIALRTPMGYALTYKYAEDVWNNNFGINIPKDKEKSETISRTVTDYLKSRTWFYEMEKFTGYVREQGEALLLLYTEDQPDLDNYAKEVNPNLEILGVEAFNYCDYRVSVWDEHGEPAEYMIRLSQGSPANRGSVPVHASRILRHIDKNIYRRETGHSLLSVVYDMIVIISNICKGAGEAAYRWGTGHPLILTKNIPDETTRDWLKAMIGTPTKSSWHILPEEYIASFQMIGQAGQMLNLRSLADMIIDQICAASGIPRPILLGEVAGVISGSEVNERSYFALLDKSHTNLEPFVRKYFERDVNIRKLFNGIKSWDLDWGLREVLTKMDAIEYRKMEISNAIAMAAFATINEMRVTAGLPEIPSEMGGDIIPGIEPFMAMPAEENEARESVKGTEKQAAADKDLNKNKKLEPKKKLDSFIDSLRKDGFSMKEVADIFNISEKTIYTIRNE